MSGPTTIRCRGCQTALGVVGRDGALEPLAPIGSIDRRGVARICCPGCQAVREWRPQGQGQGGGYAA